MLTSTPRQRWRRPPNASPFLAPSRTLRFSVPLRIAVLLVLLLSFSLLFKETLFIDLLPNAHKLLVPVISHPNATHAILTVSLGLSSIRPFSFANKQSYCNRHGVDCIFVTSPTSNRTPVWQKVEVLARVLPRYEWVWLLDLDALITNKTISIADVVANAQAVARARTQAGEDPLGTANAALLNAAQTAQAAAENLRISSSNEAGNEPTGIHSATTAFPALPASPATPRVDLIYARDYEDKGLNAGSLFFRASPRFLETDFFPHWLSLSGWFQKRELEEQGALADMLQRDYMGVRGAAVRVAMREINSYCPEHAEEELRWRRGDFVVHFPGQCKPRLIPFVRRNLKEILD